MVSWDREGMAYFWGLRVTLQAAFVSKPPALVGKLPEAGQGIKS